MKKQIFYVGSADLVRDKNRYTFDNIDDATNSAIEKVQDDERPRFVVKVVRIIKPKRIDVTIEEMD